MKLPYEMRVSRVPGKQTYILPLRDPWVQDVDASVTTETIVRSFTSNVKQARKSGTLEPLPYFRERFTYGAFPGHTERNVLVVEGHYDDRGEWLETKRGFELEHRYSGHGISSALGAPSPDGRLDHLESQCVASVENKLLSDLKGQSVNLAQAAAESRQTLSMIGDITNKLAMTYRDLRQGNLKHAAAWWGYDGNISARQASRFRQRMSTVRNSRDLDQQMSSGILQVQYGIKPLLSDLDGMAKELAEKDTRPKFGYVRARSSKVDNLSETRVEPWGPNNGKIVHSLDYSLSISVSGGHKFYVGNDVTQALCRTGMLNIPLLAWELTPWSFVADQFLPIGNYLNLLDATAGIQSAGGYLSVKRTERSVQRSTGSYSSEYANGSVNGGTFTRLNRFRRIATGGFPSPHLPSFRTPSVSSVINDIALLVQGVGNIRKSI